MSWALRRAAGCFLLTLAGSAVTAWGGEWPQILGPHRSGVADNEKLAGTWPDKGPPLVWQRDVGAGYAGPAVSRGRLVLFQRQQNDAVAVALDAASGKELWQATFPTSYSSQIAPDDGPRCVPVIVDDDVYLFGAQGDLHCVSLANGESAGRGICTTTLLRRKVISARGAARWSKETRCWSTSEVAAQAWWRSSQGWCDRLEERR